MNSFSKRAIPLLFVSAAACFFLLPLNASSKETITLKVSGDVISRELLKDFVSDCLHDLMSGEPSSIGIKNIPSDLKKGEACVIDLGKRSGLLLVAQNIALPKMDDSRLIVSNDPEDINAPGTLIAQELRRDEPVRILYYHEASRGNDLVLNLIIQNPNHYPVDLFVAKGIGGPCDDGIFAGHIATLRYMSQEKDEAGMVMTVPPCSCLVVLKHALKEAQVSTGIVKLRQLSGDPVRISLVASSNDNEPSPRLASKEDGRISGNIGKAYVDIQKEYFLGSSPLDIRIGESPTFASLSGGFDILLGNYGLIHRIALEVTNPSDSPKTASVFYIASGGPARGVFLVDNALIQTKLLNPKGNKSEKLFSFEVPERNKRSLFIEMMPEPGSFYPTRLVVLEEKS